MIFFFFFFFSKKKKNPHSQSQISFPASKRDSKLQRQKGGQQIDFLQEDLGLDGRTYCSVEQPR